MSSLSSDSMLFAINAYTSTSCASFWGELVRWMHNELIVGWNIVSHSFSILSYSCRHAIASSRFSFHLKPCRLRPEFLSYRLTTISSLAEKNLFSASTARPRGSIRYAHSGERLIRSPETTSPECYRPGTHMPFVQVMGVETALAFCWWICVKFFIWTHGS